MGFQLSGWLEFVVEVQFAADESADFQRFFRRVEDDPTLRFWTLMPSTSGAGSLGAMVEGQTTSSIYARYSGPSGFVASSMQALEALADECFPRES